MSKIEELFKCGSGEDFINEDFSIWKNDNYYHISIEGYIGYHSLDHAIDYYNGFIDKFKLWLIDSNYNKPNKINPYWNSVHRTRAIDIGYMEDCYWIFLEGHKSEEIYELLWYMEDILNQLKEVNKKLSDE